MAAAATTLLMVLYLRVSTEEQARRGYSLPEQLTECRARAKAIADQVATETGRPVDLHMHEVVDDFGGDIIERPALEGLRQYVKSNRPRYFICMDPDRFSRSLKWQLIVADEIEAAGTRVVFIQQSYDPDDTNSRAFFQFRGIMSELEKAKIIERTTRGKRGKLKQGGRPNGAAPYGYRHDKASDDLLINDEEAAWVRRMFAWVVEEQLTVYQVTRRLNDLGVLTPRGKPEWSRATVAGLLRNSSYVGEMRCNRKDFRGLGAIRRLPRERRQAVSARTRAPEEWVIVPVPLLIDRKTWDAAQQALATTTTRGGRRNTGLLSMVVRCGVCGSGMGYARHATGRYYLRCHRKYADYYYINKPERCASPHHRAAAIETGVWATLTDWLADPDLLATYLQGDEARPDLERELHRLDDEVAGLERRRNETVEEQLVIIRQQARGNLTEAVADRELARHRTILEGIDARLAEVQQRIDEIRHGTRERQDVCARFRSASAVLAATADEVRKRMGSLAADQRRHVVLRLVKAVIIQADGSWSLLPHAATFARVECGKLAQEHHLQGGQGTRLPP